jgi:anti-repressor protein
MSEIQVFKNESFGEVRAISEDGEPMFVAKDICMILGLGRQQDSTRYLDADEKGECLVDTPSGAQKMVCVTEPGFYKLVMRSRKPEAKAFQRWVTHDVLPALRRDGAYVASDGTEDDDVLMARALFAADKAIKRKDARIKELEAANAGLKAKSKAFDLWVDDTDGLISVTKAGKLLKSLDPTMGAKRLRECLRGSGYIEKATLSCTVKAIEPGYMRERMTKFIGRDGRERFKSYGALTAKGVAMCAARYCGQGSLAVE